jgi:predicted  nucleic acid-binding Zn-ribbon protein
MARSVSERRLIVVLICSLILMGCRDKNDQQASAEAAEATTSLSKTRSDLTKARREITDLKEELHAVKDIQDELDKQVAKITAERDNAVKAAMAAEQKMKNLTAQLSDVPDRLTSLENELTERNKLIESQQTTISEQQAAMAEQQATISEQEATIAALEKIVQEQMPVEEQPQEEITVPDTEVEKQQ